MFSYVRINWRGRPLINHETIVNLIANTTTSKGLSIQTELDRTDYSTGIKVSDDEIAQLKYYAIIFSWRMELFHFT